MDIDKVDFIPSALVEEYQIKVQELLKPVFDDELNEVHETYLDIQRAEALESLGIIQFFQGDWNNAIKHLDQSLSYVRVKERRGLKRVAMTQLLLGMAKFRINDIEAAIKDLHEISVTCSKANIYDISTLALSNAAIVTSKLKKFEEAYKLCRLAIDQSKKINTWKSFEHLQHVRILVALYIKGNEFEKAEELLEEFTFPEDEKRLLQSAIFYAKGDVPKALLILESMSMSLSQAFMEQEGKLDDGSSIITEEGEHQMVIPPPINTNFDNASATSATTGTSALPTPITRRIMHEAERVMEEEARARADDNMHKSEVLSAATGNSSSSIITSNYLLAVENVVEKALIAYNSMLLRDGSSKKEYQYPLQMMQSFVQSLRKRKVRIEKSRLMPKSDYVEDDPYYKHSYNSHPDFMPYDIFMYAVLTLTQLMVANSEMVLLQYPYETTVMIQEGHVVVHSAGGNGTIPEEGEDGEPIAETSTVVNGGFATSNTAHRRLEEFQKSLQRCVSLVEACRLLMLQIDPNISGGSMDGLGIGFGIQSAVLEENLEQALTSLSQLDAHLSNNNIVASNTNTNPNPSSADIANPSDASSSFFNAANANMEVDLKILRDTLHSYKQLLHCDNTDFANKRVSLDAIKLLNVHHVYIDNNTGAVLEPPSSVPTSPTSPSRSSTRGSRRKKRGASSSASKPSTASSSELDPTKAAQESAEALGFPSQAKQSTYKPAKWDKVSLRSDFNILTDYFGRDAVSGYVQWALSQMGGMSLGFLGTSIGGSEDVISYIQSSIGKTKQEDDEEEEQVDSSGAAKKAEEPVKVEPYIKGCPPKEFLEEVRNRLLEIDVKGVAVLHTSYPQAYTHIYIMPYNGPTSHLRPGETGGGLDDDEAVPQIYETYPARALESHILILLLLIKISTQLHLKTETGQHLDHFTHMARYIHKHRSYSAEAQLYYALSMRYRMEYNEWCSDRLLSEREYIDYAYKRIFPLAKSYYELSKTLSDVQIRRDALKKLINVYSLIGKPPPTNDSSSVMSSVMSVSSTNMADFLKFDDASIAHYEATDVDWMKKYGKMRAMQFMKELKSLTVSSNANNNELKTGESIISGNGSIFQ